mmetsp:Transcript_20041/g.65306  ORF Transcript_20041/g.65306 Transcript_20041/m.65306 type:complete len:222 (+) Transcript_20041:647-1312(+)
MVLSWNIPRAYPAHTMPPFRFPWNVLPATRGAALPSATSPASALECNSFPSTRTQLLLAMRTPAPPLPWTVFFRSSGLASPSTSTAAAPSGQLHTSHPASAPRASPKKRTADVVALPSFASIASASRYSVLPGAHSIRHERISGAERSQAATVRRRQYNSRGAAPSKHAACACSSQSSRTTRECAANVTWSARRVMPEMRPRPAPWPPASSAAAACAATAS